jgi:S-methylmethionine-dependent homocysteine/selenocysteine methylase
MKKLDFIKMSLCVAFLLTANLYSQSNARATNSEIKKLEVIFLNTDENDYKKLAETSRKLSIYYMQRQRRSSVIIAASFGSLWGAAVNSKQHGRKAKYYDDLYKFYAMQLYYSSEGKNNFSDNLTSPPIIYNSGKK